MTTLLNSLDFYVLPVVNIDGYVSTWTNVSTFIFLKKTNSGKANCSNFLLVLIYTSPFYFRTACGERHALKMLVAVALVQIPTGILMLAGAVSVSEQ